MPPNQQPATPLPHEHSNTAALVTGGLLIGLLLGAAGGYYGGKFEALMTETALTMQETNQDQTTAEQETAVTAESYSEIDTNPLQDVQTNPFE
jgi:uncharacterized protein HemX